jgi:hypothetical protein
MMMMMMMMMMMISICTSTLPAVPTKGHLHIYTACCPYIQHLHIYSA